MNQNAIARKPRRLYSSILKNIRIKFSVNSRTSDVQVLNMPYEIIEHTADIKIRVWGSSLEDLFSEALLVMMKIVKATTRLPTGNLVVMEHKIKVEAPDRTALLVDFLSEVLALSQTNKEIYTEVKFNKFSGTELEAVLRGVKVDEFDEDIKAVTYHEAEVRQNEKGEWETSIVFDI